MPASPDIDTAARNPTSRNDPGRHSVVMDRATGNDGQNTGSPFAAAAVVAIGVVFFLGVAFELSPLNGSLWLTGWEWPWRGDIELLRSGAFLLIPFLLIEYAQRKAEAPSFSHPFICLGILAAGNFLMQVMGMLAEPEGFGYLQRIVQSSMATSYYSDAERINGLAGWLRHFDQASLAFHSSTHPPGPILFYYVFLKLFGSPSAALVGGCAVGLVSSLGVVVTYAFAGLWTGDQRARLTASAFYAIIPAITVFFPEMDQVYPIFSMLLILFWCRSLQSNKKIPLEAVCLGAVLFVAVFFAYNLLAIGAFLAFYAIYWTWKNQWSLASVVTVLRNSSVAVGLCAGAYTLLWLTAGYKPIASFRHAFAHQHVYANLLHRSYSIFVFSDLYDFLLGAGIIALPLLLFYVYRMSENFDLKRDEIALTLIALATILTIDLTGVLRGEAARVWMFLQPLLLIPTALELSRYRGRRRTALFAIQWLIVVCLKAKMQFIRP